MGQRSGKGISRASNGDLYEGGFKHNLFDGEGTYTYVNGDVFRCTFREGLPHGQGKYVAENGRGGEQYGVWEDGQFVCEIPFEEYRE